MVREDRPKAISKCANSDVFDRASLSIATISSDPVMRENPSARLHSGLCGALRA
jgi:uncharacterized protein YlxP (DUF503 family)